MRGFGCFFIFLLVVVSFFFSDTIIEKFSSFSEIVEKEENLKNEVTYVVPEEQKLEFQVEMSNEMKETGLHTLIGAEKTTVIETFGKPNRIDPSAYGYEWYVYNKNLNSYVQIGIEQGKVVTVFYTGTDEQTNEPFSIGESFTEINEQVSFEKNVPFTFMENSYRFELTEQERNSRPLVLLDNEIWAQLYFDTFTKRLSSIRYLDSKTLIRTRPYSIVHRGELYEPDPLTKEQWQEVEKGMAAQIFDFTNVIRLRHELELLEWDDKTATVAYLHSKDMYENNYFSHTSPTHGELSDRFENENIEYQMAAENIAAQYVDGIAAVEGWLNSEGHRINLLHDEFTHLGVGVYEKYYTQNFMTPWLLFSQ